MRIEREREQMEREFRHEQEKTKEKMVRQIVVGNNSITFLLLFLECCSYAPEIYRRRRNESSSRD